MDEGLIDEPDDIFDDYEAVSDHEEENTEAANAGATNEAESAEIIPVPKKRIIRNPRLKFDADRLCGERGIPVLVEHFKNMKFKGKGHEREDLDRLLSTLEHWTHRLYPSMKFSDCLHQIEKLGKKRPVQTCLSKIRLDMPILHSDFGRVDNDDDDDVQRGVDSDPEVTRATDFDHLVEDYQQTLLDKEHQNVALENGSISRHTQSSSVSNLNGASTSASNGITEEQRLKMEQNRKLAAGRLRARLSNLNTALSNTANTFTSNDSVATSFTNDDSVDNTFTNTDLVAKTSTNQRPVNSKLSNKINNFTDAHSEEEDDSNSDAEVYRKPTKRLKIDSDDEDSVDIDDLVENSSYNESDVMETNKSHPESQRNSLFHSTNSSQLPSSSRSKTSSQTLTNYKKMGNADILFQNLSSTKEQCDDENSDSDVDAALVMHRRLKKKHIIDSDDDDDDIASELDSVKDNGDAIKSYQNTVFSSDANMSAIKSNLNESVLSGENADAIGNMSDISHHSQIGVTENQPYDEKLDFDDEVNINWKSGRKHHIDNDEMDQRVDNELKSGKDIEIETSPNMAFSLDVDSAETRDDDHSLLPDARNFMNEKTDASNYVKNGVKENQSDDEKSDYDDDDDVSPVYHKTKKYRIDSDDDEIDIDRLVENS